MSDDGYARIHLNSDDFALKTLASEPWFEITVTSANIGELELRVKQAREILAKRWLRWDNEREMLV